MLYVVGVWVCNRRPLRSDFGAKTVRIFELSLLLALSCRAQTLDGSTRVDWPHYGGTQAAWRYSSLDQVNTSNVRRLTPAWIFQTGDSTDGLRSTPLVMDGVMYL